MRRLMFWLFLASAQLFAAGSWQQWMAPSEYRQMLSQSQGLWIATNAGVLLAPKGSCSTEDCPLMQFGTASGLEDADIAALVLRGDTLYTVSRRGLISKWDGQRFATQHRSYTSLSQAPLAAGTLAAGKYLIVAFQNALAFYNVDKGKAEFFVEKMGQYALANSPVRALLLEQGTLYVALDSAIFTVRPNFDSLLASKDAAGKPLNIIDPSAWTRLTDVKSPPPYRSLWLSQGSLQTSSAPGTWLDEDNRALLGQAPKVLGVEIRDSLIGVDTASTAVLTREGWLATTKGQLWYCPKGQCHFKSLHSMYAGNYGALALAADQTPYALSGSVVSTYAGGEWKPVFKLMIEDNNPLATIQFQRNLKNFAVVGGEYVWGAWDLGMVVHAQGTSGLGMVIYNAKNSCLQEFRAGEVEPSGFAFRRDEAYGTDVLSAVLRVPNGYQIAEYRPGGDVRCLGTWKQHSGDMLVWSGDTLLAVGSETGISIHRVDAEGQLGEPQSKSTGNIGFLSQMAWDDHGRLWVGGGSQLGLLCSGEQIQGLCKTGDKDTVRSANAFFALPETMVSSVKADAAGNIWIATLGKGVYRIDVGPGVQRNALQHFSTLQGLASDTVYDIAVNRQTGDLWFGHPKAVSRYTSGMKAASARESLEPKVYPNPFRWNVHSELVLENIPAGAEVRLLTPSGRQLVALGAEDLRGGGQRYALKTHWPDLAAGVYKVVIESAKGKQSIKNLVILR